EIRVGMNEVRQAAYATASLRRRAKLAAENERKLDVVGALLRRHRGDRVLLIGQYLDQLRVLAKSFDIPLITGRTPNAERERLYAEFRDGRLDRLIVSKVGNFAIDLPDANVLIQLSGAFGSRQEEAQRLGRILRPKGEDGGDAWFYTVVTDHSTDLEFSARRQLFLAEQGYAYSIIAAEDLRPDAGSEEVRSWGA
ncbi:MAG: helicase-related protein, partial [Planctomycetota bacterium]